MKTKCPFAVSLVVMGLLLAACQPLQLLAASATETPPPTATDRPTATASPAPTHTAGPTKTAKPTETPEPTMTPDRTATIAAKKTELVADIAPDIARELDQYGLSTDEGRLGWTQKSVRMQLDSYLEWDWNVPEADLVVSDFVLHTEMIWTTTTGLAGCGFVFHATDDVEKGKQYEVVLVRLQGEPLWSLDYYNRGKFQASITGDDWLNARGMKSDQGSTNTMTLVVEGEKFALYANGERMGVYTDNTLTEGNVAFMAHQESGKTTCEFKNSWLWILK